MPASYRYCGQNIIAKLKDKVKLKLYESAWSAKDLKDRPRVPKRARKKKVKKTIFVSDSTFRAGPGNYRKGSSKFKKGICDLAPFIITPDATSSTSEKAVGLPEQNIKKAPQISNNFENLFVLRKAKLLLSLLCLKNWQFGKISPIILAITNLFSKTKRNVTQLKSSRGIPLLSKRITNRLKRFEFAKI
ncbi:hypothetical protein GGTG_07386 [Gaeumannomyces tritici R3-111a-1]|uniref:Uncharacterized protein n=1 Tax=Gaeumannomyces tritici (strain R3-111a-1) TaxID=644352 RepID=J3P1I8_GAET3|nr:hypothetical protein GGTG_07386 [Gaeumannomyces tritici R3-111a-1]EJT73530.1 hypothetical protein GGTG_07386 [Gaeumannomyces tritici R3-111a-1]